MPPRRRLAVNYSSDSEPDNSASVSKTARSPLKSRKVDRSPVKASRKTDAAAALEDLFQYLNELDEDLNLTKELAMDLAEAGLMSELEAVTESFLKMLRAWKVGKACQEVYMSFKVRPPAESDTDTSPLWLSRWNEASASAGDERQLLKSKEYTSLRDGICSVVDDWETLPASIVHPDMGGDDEDAISMAPSRINLNCPISGTLLVDPVRNPACNHVFSRGPLEFYMRSEGQQASRCPVVGCNSIVDRGRIVSDKEVQKLLDRRANRVLP